MAKKKNIKKNSIINREIQVVIAIIISIFVSLSIYTESTGIIGRFIKKFLFTFFGIGTYFIPLLIIGWFIGYIFFSYKIKRIIVGGTMIYISIIGISDVNFNKNLSDINEVYFKEENKTLGGVIGRGVSSLLESLIGKVGANIVYIALFIIGFIIISEKSLKSILSNINFNFKKEKKAEINNIGDTSKNTPIVKDKKDIPEIKKESPSISTLKEESENLDTEKKRLKTIESDYIFPPISLLKDRKKTENNEESIARENIVKLVDTLGNFGIKSEVDQVNIGPTVTKYELKIASGTKVNKITSLSNDIALSLAATDVRIEAPIPGKSAVGIEVPNKYKTEIRLKDIINSEEFLDADTSIPVGLGKDITGKPIVINIEKMPHLLIAGATGSGKSVCINTIINSILYKSDPNHVKMVLIDPKVVELSIYNGIPHLLTPVVTDPKKATGILKWVVKEMTDRYNKFAKSGSRDLNGYNKKQTDENEVIPRMVVIIDELADLMMVASSEVEDLICRIAQMARAAGIHLIIATQRPSVDVITGIIKANIPSRISFSVSSGTDSRTILDMVGAEKLLGQGDMLFYPVGYPKPVRIQGAYIDDEEVERVVDFLKNNFNSDYDDTIEEEVTTIEELGNQDELFEDAMNIASESEKISISQLQRHFKIGYNRALSIMEELENRGVVEKGNGTKARKVIVRY